MTKIYPCGTRDALVSRVHTILNSHTQWAEINNSKSEVKPITRGVVGGGVVGHIIFTTHDNEIFERVASW